MRIIKDSSKVRLPSDNAERFFIQLWYSLIHRNSLDSHRVRCMNSYNILRELRELISKTHLPGIINDIKKVAEEALDILGHDKIIKNHYAINYERITDLLKKIAKAKAIDKDVTLASYYINDMLSEMKGSYKNNVIAALDETVFSSKSEQDLFELSGTLLSLLIDEGYSIEGLYSIIQDIFISNRSKSSHTFSDNYQFMKRIVNHAHSEYEITFRLEGCNKPDFLPSKISEVIFEKEPLTESDDVKVKAYLSPGQNVIFGKIITTAQDDRAAGVLARKRLDDILDLMRFELEQDMIEISSEFLSTRLDNKSSRLFKLPSQIPNPVRNISAEEFESFVESVADLLNHKDLETGSKERIKSAIRFYRMGRDAAQFENKFLNWWTALEYLVRHEQGAIIEEIESKLKATLLLDYINKHIESFKRSLSYCEVAFPNTLATRYNVKSYADLGTADFFAFLRENNELTSIKDQLAACPALRFRLEYFSYQIKDAASITKYLSLHEQHIVRHIHRIWRIRCDIVHSAEYSLNLTLLSANLEYYLKYLLKIILSTLCRNRSIVSLTEFYARVNYSYETMVTHLKNNDMTAFTNSLRNSMI